MIFGVESVSVERSLELNYDLIRSQVPLVADIDVVFERKHYVVDFMYFSHCLLVFLLQASLEVQVFLGLKHVPVAHGSQILANFVGEENGLDGVTLKPFN